jgi:hypothetical protein
MVIYTYLGRFIINISNIPTLKNSWKHSRFGQSGLDLSLDRVRYNPQGIDENAIGWACLCGSCMS